MATVWDKEVQSFHGGQEHLTIDHLVCDFSTTCSLQTPADALAKAQEAVLSMHHYPAANFEPAISDLAEFLWGEDTATYKPLLLLGNGASELIDLAIRLSSSNNPPSEQKWKPGPSMVQYKEYERSATVNGFITSHARDPDAKLMCMVNPTNPTGDFMSLETIKSYLETTVSEGSVVLVDESMQPWVGPHWREESLVSQRQWCREMAIERNISVFVIHSWTKLWSCPGIRLGSIISPTEADCRNLKLRQVPWSVNCVALSFLSAVTKDTAYLEELWENTPIWNQQMREEIASRFPDWRVQNDNTFLSWLWIELPSEEIAEQLTIVAREAKTPIRWGKPGYELPTFVRLAVRPAHLSAILFDAIAAYLTSSSSS